MELFEVLDWFALFVWLAIGLGGAAFTAVAIGFFTESTDEILS